MKLIDQFKVCSMTPVWKTTAQAFAFGYAVPIVTMLGPYFLTTTDYVGAGITIWHDCLTNPAWLFLFFKSTLNSGIAFAIGALMKDNAFDKFKGYFQTQPPVTTLTSLPVKTSDLIDR